MAGLPTGVYTADRELDIIVLYGGQLRDDPDHRGPWVQWKFASEPDEDYTTTICFEFDELLKVCKYKLTEPREPQPMRFK